MAVQSPDDGLPENTFNAWFQFQSATNTRDPGVIAHMKLAWRTAFVVAWEEAWRRAENASLQEAVVRIEKLMGESDAPAPPETEE